jgi:mono/diheme cytochrome c family protein
VLRTLGPLLAALLAGVAVLAVLGGPSRGAGGERATEIPSTIRGRAVFARMGCGSCHRLAAGGGSEINVGPDLDELLPNYEAGSLRAKIVDPYRAGQPQSFIVMPQDFGTRMSSTELDALVAFLLSTTKH